MIELFQFQSPIGTLSVLAEKEGVVKISFPNEFIEEMKKMVSCFNFFG